MILKKKSDEINRQQITLVKLYSDKSLMQLRQHLSDNPYPVIFEIQNISHIKQFPALSMTNQIAQHDEHKQKLKLKTCGLLKPLKANKHLEITF